ncbi:hypothetical protein CYLTODRAFT_441595 [Cylindrobasidium torrendii FP15055 ss-10]|uniref:Uncharacterized protein n=1 Tax=Cylindrobasidium torrendii FP15055 ss-10 TaxID=1314674 RepID=A0A0D7BL58_9AGAR|nr:hypothetical protein CYLTODRAFT_441595 [Cylindrobasidium torrendii FP15055 ss-10]
MAEFTASIAQSYQACPVENCPCPYHRISIPEPDDFGAAFTALSALGGGLNTTNEPPTPGEEASILASIKSMGDSLDDIRSHFPSPVPSLALTCRRWNSVVLGTPKLWSHINIDLCEQNIPDANEVSEYYGRLSRQFTKTVGRGNIPLTISIGTCDAAGEDYDLNPITFLLPSFAANITHLTLFLPPTALERMTYVGPQLTRLEYATVANTVPNIGKYVFSAFSECTTLRTFNAINFDCLDDVDIPNDVKHLSLRHHSIPHSDMDYQQPENDSYGLLGHIQKLTPLKRLETLCIDIGGDDVGLPHGTCLSMKKLKKLNVTSHFDEPIYLLLQHTTAPLLESLTLSSSAGDADGFASYYFRAIGNMAQRSACHLTFLELAFVAEASPAMITALYKLPTLEHLTIRQPTKSGIAKLFGNKTLQKKDVLLLPALQTLVLEAAPILTQTVPTLAGWIEARVDSAPLKKVVIISRVPDTAAVGSNDTNKMARFRKRLEQLDGLEVRAGFSKIEELD